MSLVRATAADTGFLAEPRFGGTSLSAVSGVWSVVTALAIASLVLAVHPAQSACRSCARRSTPAPTPPCCPCSTPPALVGFGAVVAALPAFAVVRDGILAVPGGPLVSIAVAANVMGGITGSASGGLTIALNALGETVRPTCRGRGHSP